MDTANTLPFKDLPIKSENDSSEEEEVQSSCDSDTEIHPLLKEFIYGNKMKITFGSPLGKLLFNIVKETICYNLIGQWVARDCHIRLVSTTHKKKSKRLDLGTLTNPQLNKIILAAKNGETMCDKRIRKGLELSADQFTIDHEATLLKPIKQYLQKTLFPSLQGGPKGLTLKRYKMVIYQKGDHFDFHRDTLHADDHQATVLVEVTSPHKGGTLLIDPHGNTGSESHNGVFSIDFNNYETLKWVAFYTDASHKMKPVTSGTRIVIQYDVYVKPSLLLQFTSKSDNDYGCYSNYSAPKPADDDCDDEESDSDSENDNEDADRDIDSEDHDSDDNDNESVEEDEIEGTAFQLEESDVDEVQLFLDVSKSISKSSNWYESSMEGIAAVIAELHNMLSQSGTTNIAIPLFHRYSVASIKPRLLKGTDRELFDAIAKTGKYILGLSPITLSGQTDYDNSWEGGYYTANLTAPMKLRYRWDATTERARGKPITQKHLLNRRKSKYIVSNREESRCLATTDYQEHTGNEPAPATFKYFLGVIVVARK